jgi:hypothetical protein
VADLNGDGSTDGVEDAVTTLFVTETSLVLDRYSFYSMTQHWDSITQHQESMTRDGDSTNTAESAPQNTISSHRTRIASHSMYPQVLGGQ